jgi:hypothetical protein
MPRGVLDIFLRLWYKEIMQRVDNLSVALPPLKASAFVPPPPDFLGERREGVTKIFAFAIGILLTLTSCVSTTVDRHINLDNPTQSSNEEDIVIDPNLFKQNTPEQFELLKYGTPIARAKHILETAGVMFRTEDK